jgi:hypothetical protein
LATGAGVLAARLQQATGGSRRDGGWCRHGEAGMKKPPRRGW